MNLCDRLHVLNMEELLLKASPRMRNNPEVVKAYLGSAAHEQ